MTSRKGAQGTDRDARQETVLHRRTSATTASADHSERRPQRAPTTRARPQRAPATASADHTDHTSARRPYERAPTTHAPTTRAPTTARPTTARPTTARPTTARRPPARPTTARPTTARPTTAAATDRSDRDYNPRTNQGESQREGYWNKDRGTKAGDKTVVLQPQAKPRRGQERQMPQLPTDWPHLTSRGTAETTRTDMKTSAPTVPSFGPQRPSTATAAPQGQPSSVNPPSTNPTP